jgi:hypothetical protein
MPIDDAETANERVSNFSRIKDYIAVVFKAFHRWFKGTAA